MTKAVWTASAAAALLLVASAPVLAQNTANVTVTVNVNARAKLALNSNAVAFADADPDNFPSLSATALDVDVKARTGSASNVTLTVKSGGDLTTAGGDTIVINNLTWTVGGDTGYAAGTMGTTDQSLGTWTGSGRFQGTQTYHLANSWAYNTGSYTATITYTLTAP